MSEVKNIDEQIQSGAFAVVSLIVRDRLFVANVGTAHVFLCFYDERTSEKSLIPLETPHTLETYSEFERLANLNANVEANGNSISYTRCLGNFKLKYYYHEYPEFESCSSLLSKNDDYLK
jgi:hypothetical protein